MVLPLASALNRSAVHLLHNVGMDRSELAGVLASEGFAPDSYALHGSDRNDTLNIEQQGSKFVIYYSERGTRNVLHEFPTESEACDYFLNLMHRARRETKQPD